jgi:cardiolipin synthase
MKWFELYILIGWLIRMSMVPVILRRQLAPGASVAWLGIIFLHPYIGYGLYMLIGETRLGPGRVERHRALVEKFRPFKHDRHHHLGGDWTQQPHSYEPMILQAERISGMPVLAGNSIDYLTDSPTFTARLIGDIDDARSEINLLYYIFAPDGAGEGVAKALERAARRGVVCRVLVDAVGARPFLARRGYAARFAREGIRVGAAMPTLPIKRRLPRMDLRNHRKLAVIDSTVAFVGSHNIILPDYGGRRGAPWVDLSARITGPVVDELSIVFAEDWAFEMNEILPVPRPLEHPHKQTGAAMQVIPTGPSDPGETYRRVLLAALQCARERVMLTTPYFVPDEPTLVALLMAADRGVEVSLIVPLHPDHLLTAAAGRAHFGRLIDGGISIWQYRPGLLHAKTVTIDDALAIVGSANIDVRSFNLNFELSVLIYGPAETNRLREIQLGYIKDSRRIECDAWSTRPALRRYTDSAVSLLSPLL